MQNKKICSFVLLSKKGMRYSAFILILSSFNMFFCLEKNTSAKHSSFTFFTSFHTEKPLYSFTISFSLILWKVMCATLLS